MLKTLSAIAIAASILAAPAMAAGPARAFDSHKSAATERHVQVRPNALNANAKMIHRHHGYRHHHRQVRPHVHFHKMGHGHR